MTGIAMHAAARLTAATVSTLLICGAAAPALAANAYWSGARSSSWNGGIVGNSSNWVAKNGMSLRDPPSDTAIFRQNPQTATVTFSMDTDVQQILFLPNAGLFQFFLGSPQLPKQILRILGTGIRNRDTSQAGFFIRFNSRLRFEGRALIDDPGTVLIVNGETARTLFTGKSNGGIGVVQNVGMGRIVFSDRASAGRMHITNFDQGTQALFTGRSTGGSATVSNDQGLLKFDTSTVIRPTIGKIFNKADMEITRSVHLIVRRLLNLHQQGFPAGRLLIRMPGPSSDPRITVLRHARLGGVLRVAADRFVRRGNHVLIKANSRAGRFATVRFSGRFGGTPSVFYRGAEVVLRVQ